MNSDISKQEYLKRYLEGNDKEKKRKKRNKTTKSTTPGIKIVDQDISIKTIKFGTKEEVEEDESPVVAEVIDDRPEEIKSKEIYKSSKWKKIGEDESETLNVKKDDLLELCKNKKQSVQNKTSNTKKLLISSQRHDSDSDLSPVPTSRRHDSDSDLSPTRVSRRHASDSDCSPIRQQQFNFKHQNNATRKIKNDKLQPKSKNFLPSHKNQKSLSDSDLSPERDSNQNITSRDENNYDSDLSPPRMNTYLRKRSHSPSANKNRPKKTLSGLKAGLQNAATLREETKELRKKEKVQIKQLDAELSGRNADTIVRDRRTGKKVDVDAEMRITAEKEKKNYEQQQKYTEWGKGIQQTESKKMKLSEDMYEMSKPLARYCDDDDLEERLKAEIHDDDPMAQYMRKKKQKDSVSAYPLYKGPPPPPNRFQISPGYRWDGVDRSNGFEKRYFENKSSKKANEEEAYLWSIQDM